MRRNMLSFTRDTTQPSYFENQLISSHRVAAGGARSGFSRQVLLRLSAVVVPVLASAIMIPGAAQGEELRAEAGWKCAVAIPAAKAAAAAAGLTLKAAQNAIPTAERKLAQSRVDLKKARAAADAAKNAVAADPSNVALADAAKTTARVASAQQAAVNAAAKSLKVAKAGLPKATEAVKKAKTKLEELNSSCA